MEREFFCIDKTESMQKALQIYPILFVEGAAATGKTTAVNMLLRSVWSVQNLYIYDMVLECEDFLAFEEKMKCLKTQMQSYVVSKKDPGSDCAKDKDSWYVVFENLHKVSDEAVLGVILDVLYYMSSNLDIGKCICISREKPDKAFLPFIWNRKMEQIGMADLMLSKDEVGQLLHQTKSWLGLDELYAITGGWAGCVDMMLRLSVRPSFDIWTDGTVEHTATALRNSYEIDAYIKEYILKTLSLDENLLLQRSQLCPWINAVLCREVLGMSGCEQLLEGMTRKGFLIYEQRKKCWRTAPLFQKSGRGESGFWKDLGDWYERNHYIKEALDCFEKSQISELHKDCMIRHYEQIPYSDISYEVVLNFKETQAECMYLRAMYYYEHQKMKEFEQECKRYAEFFGSQQESGTYTHKDLEIYLNLEYVNPEVSIEQWLEKVTVYADKEGSSIRIYHMLGCSVSALCGIRDLTNLFACIKKEENKKQRIWRTYLDEDAWKTYNLAKIEYYLETERIDSLSLKEQDWILNPRRIEVLNLLIKVNAIMPELALEEHVRMLADELICADKSYVSRQAKAMQIFYLQKEGGLEPLIRWIRQAEIIKPEVCENSYIFLGYLIKGYMQLYQYEKAKKLILLLIPYLQQYKRGYFLAEHLYQLAIILWEENRHGQALKTAIESFLIGGQGRYVKLYADFGEIGIGVLEEFIKWMQANAPKGWHRKKKYQYGNVLRMPEADYMDVIMRCMKRKQRTAENHKKSLRGEHLTMMEMLILQDINRGLTNAQICEELNVKMPTVKTHIYSIYKKLNVNSRVQAIIKGKERGLL